MAPHLDLLNQALVDVARGRNDRLMVFMPPRHGKSELISKYFPTWFLGRYPDKRVILTSYEASFASSWGRKARDLMWEFGMPVFGRVVSGLASQMNWWEIAGHDGAMMTAGVGGPITGKGADVFVIDDPVKNEADANSETMREHAWEWWQSTASTRLEPGSAVILVMTRWHEADLAGKLLEQAEETGDRWKVLSFPAMAEATDALGREPGEALWPWRYDETALQRIKDSRSDYWWNAMYQQRPSSPTGSAFKREWWDYEVGAVLGKRLYELPNGARRFDPAAVVTPSDVIARYITIDTSQKDKDTNAYNAACVFELMADYRIALRYVWRERLIFPDLVDKITALATDWDYDGKLRNVIIEDLSSGVSAIQTLQETAEPWLAGIVTPFAPRGSKVERAHQAAVWCKKGCVLLPLPTPDAPWLHDFLAELYGFPFTAFLDQVDAFDQGILFLEHMLAEGWRVRGGEDELAA